MEQEQDSKASGEKADDYCCDRLWYGAFHFQKGDDFKGYDIDLVKAIFKDSGQVWGQVCDDTFWFHLDGVDSGRFIRLG